MGNAGGPRRRHRRRWEDNIKPDIREMDWSDINWFYLTEDRDHWRAFANLLV
jgi:hypothetical protein